MNITTPAAATSNGSSTSFPSAATTQQQQPPPSLYQLLKSADLLEYQDQLRHKLKLRHAGDLADVEEKDLTHIGMSRPEQKRLKREYQNLCPQPSLTERLKKVFGRGGGTDVRYENQGATTSMELDGDEQHIISPDSIEICRELGRGEFGICYQGSWMLPHGDAIQVAIKRVPPEKLKSNPMSFLQEAGVMTRMRHENVIRMYGVVLDTKSVMLVSELAPYGSLLECLRNPAWDEPFAVDKLCEFARQIACGMAYLSAQRLIHRDLAARNVLVSALTKVKISDFGLSRWLGVNEEYYRSDFSPTMKLPIAWCAPECINVLRFTSASDVYAYGVTLWEMFSYGRMPWEGCTGAQILHSIDTQRKVLDQPAACPTQFYTLMRRCWTHDSEKRPKFDEIAEQIPELMPQLLIAAVDCLNGEEGRLQFRKGETIILLDKSRNPTPPTDLPSPDSTLWRGALRNGQTGLFKPEETVAFLGAENPTATKPFSLTTNGQPKTKEREGKNSKVKDKEKRKLLISEPQGDLRHTCHVGLDGKVFGLIHINKNDLSTNKTNIPLIGLSDPASLSIAPSTTLMSASSVASSSSAVSPAARSTTTIASSTGSTCSSSNQFNHQNRHSQRSATSPTRVSATSPTRISATSPTRVSATSPTIASVRELGTRKPDTIVQNGYDIPQRMPKQFHMPPPALPPKPAARIKPQRSLATDSMQSPPRPPSIAHRTQSLPKHTDTSSTLSSDLTRPKSITADTGFFIDSKATTEPIDNMSRSFHDSSQLLDEVLTNLQKDISDFSFSTINDFSDTRPLIKPEKQQRRDQFPTEDIPSHVRPLTEPESERLTKRISDEHKKAARSLAKEFQQFQRLSSVDKTTKSDDADCSDNYTSKIGASSNEEWSQEAQAAYKLLIECGDYLKTTSPTQPSTDRLSKSPNACVSSSTDNTDSTVRNIRSSSPQQDNTAPPLPPKKIQYINHTLVDHDDFPAKKVVEDEAVEQVEIFDQRQTVNERERYQNATRLSGSSVEEAPQIPPKPKARQNLPPKCQPSQPQQQNKQDENAGRFGAAVQRTALFSSFPKDEVVKF